MKLIQHFYGNTILFHIYTVKNIKRRKNIVQFTAAVSYTHLDVYKRQTKHTENVMSRVYEARETLMLAETYMSELGKGIDTLSKIKLSDKKVLDFMQEFFPVDTDLPDAQRKNNFRMLQDMKARYFDAPDLSHVGKNGYRFINAISDFATHADPIRRTKNYNENLFLKTVEGNPMIDKAYKMILSAA